MKTIKRRPGMPLEAKYITRDDTRAEYGEAWRLKPQKHRGGTVWFGSDSATDGLIGLVYTGRALKPGEIAKIVP